LAVGSPPRLGAFAFWYVTLAGSATFFGRSVVGVVLPCAPAMGLPSTPETGPVQRLARSGLRPRGTPPRGRSAFRCRCCPW
jgi:hypothetical protein